MLLATTASMPLCVDGEPASFDFKQESRSFAGCAPQEVRPAPASNRREVDEAGRSGVGGTHPSMALVGFLLDVLMALVAPRMVLVAENLVLRQQVIVLRRGNKRPHLRRFDRYLIGAVAGRFRARIPWLLSRTTASRASHATTGRCVASCSATTSARDSHHRCFPDGRSSPSIRLRGR